MPTQIFSADIAEHAAFIAYPNTVPVIGENVNGWQVDSQGQIFQYKIIHNLNLADPGQLIVQLSNVHSDSINPPDTIHARVLPGYANYFVVQGTPSVQGRSVSGMTPF